MEEINANAFLTWLVVAFGGFMVKYIWDLIVAARKQKDEKAVKYDQQELQDMVEHVVQNACAQLRGEVDKSMTEFKEGASNTFDYWKEMYWKAVKDLNAVEEDFNNLKKQDLIFYRYQLINACKKYIAQGYITQYQFDRLTELHKIYHDLHGNSQGDLYFDKATKLPLSGDNKYRKIDAADDEIYVTDDDMRDTHAQTIKTQKEGE